jgi:hypothetical protein
MNLDDLRVALSCFPLEMRRGSARCIELFLLVADLQGQSALPVDNDRPRLIDVLTQVLPFVRYP